MKLNRAGEAESSASQTLQTLESGSQCQVVALNALSKDLTGQVLLFWRLSGIAAPFISGQHTDVKGGEQCQ